eukprot:CAMPEP_0171455104 /NCGR_PEP_ID=MMETSP0945-20130129/2132_1 /TAXON_ID=109269 /ORGANISM="Vaucheria litorea, Strain CCMP2940" /LENGTH=266 /DNA_ID=CAMNT_0011980277 /DNA_START=587 /DNA_END=1383 /DNA_ORIENTATION=-
MARRLRLVTARNKYQETPLHYAGKFQDPDTSEAHSVARVQIGAWLVENGADPNAITFTKDTPMHYALKSGHFALASALSRRGGDLSLKSVMGESCMDLIRPEDLDQVVVGFYKAADLNQLLPPPNKPEGLSYFTLHVEKLNMHTTVGLAVPFLTVSVHDIAGKRLERQDINSPVVVRPNYLWWGTNWHMQNPLEHLGDDCIILIELKDKNTKTGAVSSLGWAAYHMNPSTVTSHEVSIEMFLPPVNFSMLDLSFAEIFISGDIVLT